MYFFICFINLRKFQISIWKIFTNGNTVKTYITWWDILLASIMQILSSKCSKECIRLIKEIEWFTHSSGQWLAPLHCLWLSFLDFERRITNNMFFPLINRKDSKTTSIFTKAKQKYWKVGIDNTSVEFFS